ncbi:MAG: DUF58 domain-containing protein [Candidatus Aenigmarchaeota archaeon]|nr:DUF58 domain-containing protein [Candidatus Aenigmarchaeota archaeon]
MKREEVEEEINKNVPMISAALERGLTFKSPFLKGGVEFSRLKPYVPGEDPVKAIDWKISARSGKVLVREYVALQKLGIFIVLDSSASMDFGTTRCMKYEYATIIAGTLIRASLSSQINIGMCFSDENRGMTDFVRPAINPRIYKSLLDLGLNREYKGKFNFKKTLESILGFVDPNSVVIILSDFLNVGEGWEDKLLTASKKFNSLLCLSIRDPSEEDLPKVSKDFRLYDPETGGDVVVNLRKVRMEYKKIVEREEEKLKEKIVKNGAVYRRVLTTQPFDRIISEFITTGR